MVNNMMNSAVQAPSAVVMVRPHHFTPNPQTKGDNSYQVDASSLDTYSTSKLAFEQVTQAIALLRERGIDVHVFEDTGTKTPDSVFPNNWFSTHSDGQIAIYPMYAKNRRDEVRHDVIEVLEKSYQVDDVIDYSTLASNDLFLEGTGAMVLDHHHKLAYAVRSKRISEPLFERFCQQFDYQGVLFNALDSDNKPVYHTNVLICVATDFVLIGDELIKNEAERATVLNKINETGKKVVSLSNSQINLFCGNALELTGRDGRILALSQTAFNALNTEQKQIIEQSTTLVPIDVSALELAGGSIRCMLAGVHLPKRTKSANDIKS